MSDRLLIVAAVAALVVVGYLLIKAFVALRRRRVLGSPADDTPPTGEPVVLAFSTADCARCRDQARALGEVESHLGGRVRVRKVDALGESTLAERYGVMTVPSTVVLDGAGQPRAVNYGFAPAAKLESQVSAILSGEAIAA